MTTARDDAAMTEDQIIECNCLAVELRHEASNDSIWTAYRKGLVAGIAHAKAELAQDVVIEWKEVNKFCFFGYVDGWNLFVISYVGHNSIWWRLSISVANYDGTFPSLPEAQAEAVRQVTALKNCLIAALNKKEEGK